MPKKAVRKFETLQLREKHVKTFEFKLNYIGGRGGLVVNEPVFLKNGYPLPLFRLFSYFPTNITIFNFQNNYTYVKKIHPVHFAGIRTHELQNMSFFP